MAAVPVQNAPETASGESVEQRFRRLEASWEGAGIRRVLFIPLVVHDEVIGALGVFKTRPRPYRERRSPSPAPTDKQPVRPRRAVGDHKPGAPVELERLGAG